MLLLSRTLLFLVLLSVPALALSCASSESPPSATATSASQQFQTMENAKQIGFNIDHHDITLWIPEDWKILTQDLQQNVPDTRQYYFVAGEVLPNGLMTDSVSVSVHSENPAFDLDEYISWRVEEIGKQSNAELLGYFKVNFWDNVAVQFDVQFQSLETGKPFYSTNVVLLIEEEGMSFQLQCLRIKNDDSAIAKCAEILNTITLE